MSKKSLIAAIKKVAVNMLPDNVTHQFRFEIKSSSSNRLYIIAQAKKSKQWQCKCPGWIHHRTCKHLNSILPMLEEAEKKKLI